MAGKKATVDTLESFAVVGNETIKENVEKAVAAFGDLNAFSKENVEAFVESMTKAGKGVEAINTHAMEYTKTSLEDGVSAAKKLASAKSMQELIELQTDFAKSSFDSYIGEVNKMSDLVASTMKDAVKPLNARVTAAVELMQAAR